MYRLIYTYVINNDIISSIQLPLEWVPYLLIYPVIGQGDFNNRGDYQTHIKPIKTFGLALVQNLKSKLQGLPILRVWYNLQQHTLFHSNEFGDNNGIYVVNRYSLGSFLN